MTTLRQLAAGQSPYALVNALFSAVSPAGLYAIDNVGTSGLTLSLYGGTLRIGGALVTVADQPSLGLSASTTHYVDVDLGGLGTTSGIRINSTAPNPEYLPLYTIVTGASAITSITEHPDRARWFSHRSVVNMASDANKTLTQAEALIDILEITSTTLTATRDIILPLIPRMYVVFNNTTGSQSIRFIGASGTGITVANGKRAIIYADGTNIVRVTADT